MAKQDEAYSSEEIEVFWLDETSDLHNDYLKTLEKMSTKEWRRMFIGEFINPEQEVVPHDG